MKHLKKQLMIQLFTALLAVSAVFFIIVKTAVWPVYRTVIRNRMQEAFQTISVLDFSALEEEEEEELDVLEEILEQFFVLLFDSDGNLLQWQQETEGNAGSRRAVQIYRDRDLFSDTPKAVYIGTVGQEPIVLRGIVRGEKDYYVYLEKSTRSWQRTLQSSSSMLFGYLIILMLVYAVLLWFCLGRALQPFDELRKGIRALIQGDYEFRLPVRTRKDESSELAEEFNQMAEQAYYRDFAARNYAYLTRSQAWGMDQLNTMQKNIVTNITHQLKTPLAILSNQVELEQLETDPVKKEYYYDSIMEEIDKMSELIRDILKNAKEENEISGAKLRRISLTDLISDLVPKYQTWLTSHDLLFSARLMDKAVVMGDSGLIEQALNNYMMNALQHTRNGKQIELSMKEEDGQIFVSVYNEGDGVAKEDLIHIWENHYQGTGEKRESELGLGLYIVKEIMASHHGSCGVKNTSEGVEFWICFPPYEDIL